MSATPPQTRIVQHADRSVPDRGPEFLQDALVAHVGFSVDGRCYVIPMTYHFEAGTPSRLYLHGGQSSRLMQHLQHGAAVCVEVTLVDGLVYSRTALTHSVNYRSAMVFGRSREVAGREEKNRILEGMIGRYFPGRTAGRDYEAALAAHLDSTVLIEVAIDDMSAKTRSGPPRGPNDSADHGSWTCGVVELSPPR